MKNLTFKVTENNGGGIALYLVDANGNEFAHNGYEYNPSQLFEDLKSHFEDDSSNSWEGNDLKNEDICAVFRTKTEYSENGQDDVLDNDEMFDENGELIPLDIDDYFDDHESTKLVLEGDENEMTIYRSNAGHSFSECLKNLTLLFDLEDYCPKITIE